MFVGVAAETANAGWYAVEGDYLMAGVSLASVAPGLGFAKLAHCEGHCRRQPWSAR